MVIYDSAKIYVDSASTLRDKITKLGNIISALEDSILNNAANSGFTEYSLDNGQTKITQGYRSPEEVARAITTFEMIRTRYINKLNGRHVRLVDSKNFTRWNNGIWQ
jgi:hypothetical protein